MDKVQCGYQSKGKFSCNCCMNLEIRERKSAKSYEKSYFCNKNLFSVASRGFCNDFSEGLPKTVKSSSKKDPNQIDIEELIK